MDNSAQISFMGLNFHNLTLAEAVGRLEDLIASHTRAMGFSPTAHLIVMADEDKRIKEIYGQSEILTIDSFVVYYAAKILGKPVKEPVSFARLMFKFLEVAQAKRYRLYFLGATEEVVRLTVSNLQKQYPGINIVGWHNGYFDLDNDAKLVEQIKRSNPDVLFVAMSSPLKEFFIHKNWQHFASTICLGVGGSFDIIAGKCNLAPAWISRLGLEWFYRLAQEPRRLWKRYTVTNLQFIRLFLREMFRS